MSITKGVPGLQELSVEEMRTTDGGLVWLLVIPVVLLVAGCATTGGNERVRDAVTDSPHS
jgi:hypothetical protein